MLNGLCAAAPDGVAFYVTAHPWEGCDDDKPAGRQKRRSNIIFHRQHRLRVCTHGKGLTDITADVRTWLNSTAVTTGLLTIFIRHTSASLIVQENADPAMLRDLRDFFERIAPEEFAYAHNTEGPDDMPAHIRAALTQTSISIPVCDGALVLGTWQGIYIFEHRRAPHDREVVLHLSGES